MNRDEMYLSLGVSDKVLKFGETVLDELKPRFAEIEQIAELNQVKVIAAMQAAANGFHPISSKKRLTGCQPPQLYFGRTITRMASCRFSTTQCACPAAYSPSSVQSSSDGQSISTRPVETIVSIGV